MVESPSMCRVTPLAAGALELLTDDVALLFAELLTLEVALLLELLAFEASLESPPPPQATSTALNSAALSQVVILFHETILLHVFFRHHQLGSRLLLTDWNRC